MLPLQQAAARRANLAPQVLNQTREQKFAEARQRTADRRLASGRPSPSTGVPVKYSDADAARWGGRAAPGSKRTPPKQGSSRAYSGSVDTWKANPSKLAGLTLDDFLYGRRADFEANVGNPYQNGIDPASIDFWKSLGYTQYTGNDGYQAGYAPTQYEQTRQQTRRAQRPTPAQPPVGNGQVPDYQSKVNALQALIEQLTANINPGIMQSAQRRMPTIMPGQVSV